MGLNKSKIYANSDDDFKSLVTSCYSYSEILRKLELVTNGSASRTVLKRRILELNIDINHFDPYKNSVLGLPKISLEKILVENSSYYNNSSLKKRLLKDRIITYKCSICNLHEWLDAPISLQLDHINGVNTDNRIGNLRLLCPNCHSQTITFAGKNIKKTPRPKLYENKLCKWCNENFHCKTSTQRYCSVSCRINGRIEIDIDKSKLEMLIWTYSFQEVGARLGISDNGVKKRALSLKCKMPPPYFHSKIRNPDDKLTEYNKIKIDPL